MGVRASDDGAWQTGRMAPSERRRRGLLQAALSEARRPTESGRAVWERIYKDNHYLDCEVSAVAAAHILRLYRLSADTVVHKHKEAPVSEGQTRARGVAENNSRRHTRMTVAEDQTMLDNVNAAINAILTGAQHFAIGDKQVTRADLGCCSLRRGCWRSA